MSTSQGLRILFLLTSGARNLEKLVLLVVVLLLIACLANLTNILVMDVITDFASCDTVSSSFSSTENVFVVEEGSERKCTKAVVHGKIFYDLRSASVPGYKDSSSISSPSSGSDEEFYATPKNNHFISKSHRSPCESPSDLMQTIMNHVFKIAKQDVHQSSQQKEHSKTETPEESMNVESAIDLNLSESYTSHSLFDQDVGENIKHELPFCSPLVKSTYITHRKSRTQYYSPFKPAEQDFLQETLQATALQSNILLKESIGYNELHCQDNVEISEVLDMHDKECDQEPLSCSEKLPAFDDLRSSVCPFCKKDFVEKYRRDRHMVSQACKRTLHTRCLKSTGSGWICELCPTMMFSSKKEASKHAAVHKIKPRTCPVCGEDFKDKRANQLLQHTRKYHPQFFS